MRFFSIFLFLVIVSTSGKAQNYPLGYIKYFDDKPVEKDLPQQFHTTNATHISAAKGIIHVNQVDDSTNSFHPVTTVLVQNKVLGDYISTLQLYVSASNETDSLSGIYFITGVRDTANYYFIQLNTDGCFFYKKYKNEIDLIDADSSLVLKEKVWQNITINRDILKRTIQIKANNAEVVFSDPNLVMGYFGLGEIDYKFSFKNLEIWAPTAIEKETTIFGQ